MPHVSEIPPLNITKLNILYMYTVHITKSKEGFSSIIPFDQPNKYAQHCCILIVFPSGSD